ncbi:MAG TPA: hypothetical protein VLQ80_12945 [Candidatus Saccharimonadia bacterium]|nr:hypothetical protein [Candidatus Saccharimonadia bacterium]
MDVERNATMIGGNRFKLAVFGSNCSSGRAATTVPERWPNTFEENIPHSNGFSGKILDR